MNKKLLCVAILIVLAAYAVFAATTDNSPAPEAAVSEVSQESAAPAEKDPERVLARVEGEEIREMDVDNFLTAAGPQVAMMYDNEMGRRLILDQLVTSRLLALFAKEHGFDENPEFKRTLNEFVTQALARAAIEEIMRDVTVSDEESREFYDENPDQFVTPEEIHASHILIADDETSADKIAFIQEELNKGVSFDVLAAEHSIDPSARQNSGDLGFFGRGRMVPEFEEAAFALEEPGDISEPVQSQFGWHVIKLEEKKPSSVISYDEIKPQIEQYLSNEKMSRRYEETLEALRETYEVEMLTD